MTRRVVRWGNLSALLCGIMVILASAGCKKVKWGGKVSGEVYHDKQLLKSGAVTLIGPNGDARNCEIKDGKYEIDQAPFGKCTITVMTTPPPPPGDGVDPPKFGSKEWPKGDFVEIHADYANPAKSGLSVEVTEKPLTHNIELVSK